jgi:hypothetical protein
VLGTGTGGNLTEVANGDNVTMERTVETRIAAVAQIAEHARGNMPARRPTVERPGGDRPPLSFRVARA